MSEFRQPVLGDEFDDSLYITASQLGVFCNSDEGLDSFKNESPDFIEYLKVCMMHNLVYDFAEKDPNNYKLYWDGDTNSIGYIIRKNSPLDKKLKRTKLI